MHLSSINICTNECVFARECPEGFISGRLFQKNIGE